MDKRIMELEEFADEIIPNLWVGERWACDLARDKGFNTICVLETRSVCNHGCLHIPILDYDRRHLKPMFLNDEKTHVTREEYRIMIQTNPKMLKRAHNAINELMEEGPVLVHCAAGIERSPLTVATWLCDRYNMTLDEAYDLVIAKRPIVEKRNFWLNDAERNRFEGKRLDATRTHDVKL